MQNLRLDDNVKRYIAKSLLDKNTAHTHTHTRTLKKQRNAQTNEMTWDITCKQLNSNTHIPSTTNSPGFQKQ